MLGFVGVVVYCPAFFRSLVFEIRVRVRLRTRGNSFLKHASVKFSSSFGSPARLKLRPEDAKSRKKR